MSARSDGVRHTILHGGVRAMRSARQRLVRLNIRAHLPCCMQAAAADLVASGDGGSLASTMSKLSLEVSGLCGASRETLLLERAACHECQRADAPPPAAGVHGTRHASSRHWRQCCLCRIATGEVALLL